MSLFTLHVAPFTELVSAFVGTVLPMEIAMKIVRYTRYLPDCVYVVIDGNISYKIVPNCSVHGEFVVTKINKNVANPVVISMPKKLLILTLENILFNRRGLKTFEIKARKNSSSSISFDKQRIYTKGPIQRINRYFNEYPFFLPHDDYFADRYPVQNPIRDLGIRVGFDVFHRYDIKDNKGRLHRDCSRNVNISDKASIVAYLPDGQECDCFVYKALNYGGKNGLSAWVYEAATII